MHCTPAKTSFFPSIMTLFIANTPCHHALHTCHDAFACPSAFCCPPFDGVLLPLALVLLVFMSVVVDVAVVGKLRPDGDQILMVSS
jgi:hypothetical protein